MKVKTFKKLLIPIDFSVTSNNALNYSLFLASKMNAELVLLHTYNFTPVVDLSAQLVDTIDISNEIIKVNEVKLLSIIDQIAISHPNVSTKYFVLPNGLTDAVELVCNDEKIDLVIMGTEGADGFDEHFLGTNTARIISNIKSPVLVIPIRAKFQLIKNIIFTTDFQFDDVAVLENLVEIASIFEAKIEVIHLSKNIKSDDELLDWLKLICKNRIDYKLINFTNILEGEKMSDTLNNLITKKGINLVSMSSTNKSFFEKIFTGSFTQKMAYHTKIPLLVFNISNFKKL